MACGQLSTGIAQERDPVRVAARWRAEPDCTLTPFI